jgi:hypothetical protein
MRSLFMWGTVLVAAVIFLILFVVTRVAGYYRGRLSVADTSTTTEDNVGTSAAIGVSSGVTVLLLLFLLYVGITRWDWTGSPIGGAAHTVSTPAPISSPANPVVSSPSSGASPSPKTSP